jgi:hypothetical protein
VGGGEDTALNVVPCLLKGSRKVSERSSVTNLLKAGDVLDYYEVWQQANHEPLELAQQLPARIFTSL